MAGFLVYRPVTDDRNRLELDIEAVLVNGADAAAAKVAAVLAVTKLIGPNNAILVNNWTATQIAAADFGTGIANAIVQGSISLPGQHLRGGGLIVS